MHAGRFLFSELMAHFPHKEFQRCVSHYSHGPQPRRFSYWDQYLAMAFAQLTYRESLRDIEACLRSVTGKLYHLGFRGQVARTTLADANETRDWRIFAEFAHVFSMFPALNGLFALELEDSSTFEPCSRVPAHSVANRIAGWCPDEASRRKLVRGQTHAPSSCEHPGIAAGHCSSCYSESCGSLSRIFYIDPEFLAIRSVNGGHYAHRSTTVQRASTIDRKFLITRNNLEMSHLLIANDHVERLSHRIDALEGRALSARASGIDTT
ncbi:MAG: DUF4372 domain-containing protein [Bryobacterales bacterium]|nr:DUF4372 domain-containing protein [Bryobacterales bacterium]